MFCRENPYRSDEMIEGAIATGFTLEAQAAG
jgi:hypothetical protein